jgi:hypothetical protein
VLSEARIASMANPLASKIFTQLGFACVQIANRFGLAVRIGTYRLGHKSAGVLSEALRASIANPLTIKIFT